MKAKSLMPKEVFIYIAQWDTDGEPLFGVAQSVDEIPPDCDNTTVGVYARSRALTFRVRKELL